MQLIAPDLPFHKVLPLLSPPFSAVECVGICASDAAEPPLPHITRVRSIVPQNTGSREGMYLLENHGGEEAEIYVKEIVEFKTGFESVGSEHRWIFESLGREVGNQVLE